MKRKKRYVTFDVWKAAMAYLNDSGREFLLDEHMSFISGLIRARDIDRLARISTVIGFCYSDPQANRTLSQISAFFKKNASFADDAKCTSQAFKSFTEAEEKCAETNLRLYNYYRDEAKVDPQLYRWVNDMRNHIRRLCGDRASFLNSLPKGVKVTAGATCRLPRAKSLPYVKVAKKACGTSGGTQLFKWFQEYVGMTPWITTVVESNRIALVLKNYLTHRTVAAEGELNMFFQTAIDADFKAKLLKFGIDLSDQSRNKELARLGSISDKLATIDLSMASDTMAREVVHLLFPDEWCELFELLRSPTYEGVFGEGTYHKFSSMGNGFTFVLETAIFWAAMKAVRSKTVSVYGDDIVIDSDKYEDALEILSFIGFVPNKDKSFHKGPFRESCGGDYFRGVDIRPFFVKKSEGLSKPDACHLINGLASIAGDSLSSYLLSVVKANRLPLVPFNDNSRTGIHVDPLTCYKKRLIITSNQIQYFKGYVEKHRTKEVRNVKTMILWFVQKFNSLEPCESSRVLLSSTIKYARVRWQIPSERPIHLYWWSELLSRRPG